MNDPERFPGEDYEFGNTPAAVLLARLLPLQHKHTSSKIRNLMHTYGRALRSLKDIKNPSNAIMIAKFVYEKMKDRANTIEMEKIISNLVLNVLQTKYKFFIWEKQDRRKEYKEYLKTFEGDKPLTCIEYFESCVSMAREN